MTGKSRINVGAFVWALVTVPLIVFLASAALAIAVGALGFPIASIFLLVPAVGAILGLPTYLTFGTVAFLRTLERRSPFPRSYAWNGFLAHAASLPIVVLCLWLAAPKDWIDSSMVFAGMGAVFAPVFGAFFGKLYRYFSTSIPQTPA